MWPGNFFKWAVPTCRLTRSLVASGLCPFDLFDPFGPLDLLPQMSQVGERARMHCSSCSAGGSSGRQMQRVESQVVEVGQVGQVGGWLKLLNIGPATVQVGIEWGVGVKWAVQRLRQPISGSNGRFRWVKRASGAQSIAMCGGSGPICPMGVGSSGLCGQWVGWIF